jgi:hypothetical protein
VNNTVNITSSTKLAKHSSKEKWQTLKFKTTFKLSSIVTKENKWFNNRSSEQTMRVFKVDQSKVQEFFGQKGSSLTKTNLKPPRMPNHPWILK